MSDRDTERAHLDARPSLTDFLLARIAEDEAVAKAAGSSGDDRHWWVDGPGAHSGKWWIYSTGEKFAHEHTARHIARHDPARIIAECESKRQVVQLEADLSEWNQTNTAILALPYADHPDYLSEWRP